MNNSSNKVKDIFKRVEIEINTGCNRKEDFGEYCSYCPNSIIEPIYPPQFMDNDLYKKIITELAEIGFLGRLSFHFYGEPLIHPHLKWIVEYTSIKLPMAEKVLYTNGYRLTDSIYDMLVKAGINLIAISQHNNSKFKERPFQKLIENFHINNKGGLLGSIKTLNLPCFAPKNRLIIAYNGDVLLCYEDAMRTKIFGNVKNKSIKAVWFSEDFNKIRKLLIDGNRCFEPCSKCDNQSHTKFEDINVNKFNS